MKHVFQALGCLCLCGLLILPAGCGPAPANREAGGSTADKPVELTLFAAASLSDVLGELAPLYEASHPGVKLRFQFASTGALQHQIENGAPCDLFLSAAPKQMDTLVKEGLIDPRQVSELVTNELVLIAPKQSGIRLSSFSDLNRPDVRRIAVGNPDTVPAGAYARQALTRYGLWDAVQPKLVFAKDVRQVLTYVETGNADAGVVYKTDALSSAQVKMVATAPPDSHERIVYPLGVAQQTAHPAEARELYRWLKGPEAAPVFAKHGFTRVGP